MGDYYRRSWGLRREYMGLLWEKLKEHGQARGGAHGSVELVKHYLNPGESFIDVYHYDTLILRVYPGSGVACPFGGYSATDRDIINDVLRCSGLYGAYKARIINGDLELIYTED